MVKARAWDFISSNERLGASLADGPVRDAEMTLQARLPEAEAIWAQARTALETPGRVEEELSLLRLVLASFLTVRRVLRAGRAIDGIEHEIIAGVEERLVWLSFDVRHAIRAREGEWKPKDPERFARAIEAAETRLPSRSDEQ